MAEKMAPPKGAPMQHTRTMAVEIDRAALSKRAEGEESELIPIALSSEFPVERYDWWEGERYLEILDHSPDAIDLSRAERGLPFLDSHNAYDGRAHLGRIMNVRVEDGKLRGDIRFSARQEAQDYRRDMLDGIRTDISIGYRIDPNNVEISKKDGELKTVRVKRWTPYEASGVAVPADPTVGVGRSADISAEAVEQIARAVTRSITQHPAPKAEESNVEQTTTAAPANGAAPNITAVRDNDAAKEMQDVSKVAGELGLSDIFAKGFAAGKAPNDIRNDLMAEMRARLERGQKAITNPVQHVVDLSEREEREYSYARAIASAMDGTPCLELEVSQAIEAKLDGSMRERGTGKGMRLYVPTTIRTMPKGFADVKFRAGLDSGTANKGTELKYVEPGSFIALLRNKARVLQLGATYMAGLTGPVTFPKQTGAGTVYWMGENPAADVTLSEMSFGTVSLNAKTLMAQTKFSRQLLRQANSVDVENLVRNDLAAIHGLGIDLAAINGPGTSNQPTGILNLTSIGSVALGPNGGAPDFAAMVKLETNVEKSNANTGPMGYLTTPSVKGTLKTTQVFASTNGVPVWLGGEEGEVNGYRAYSSNQVPSNLTKGTSTTVCHAVIFGAWGECLIGEWGAMEILVDPYTLSGKAMIAVTSFQMTDVAVRHEESFAAIKDALPASGF